MNFTAYDHTGKKIQLVGTNKSGGEGVLHEIQGNSSLCAKVFHPDKITKELNEKISTMVANPPNDPTWSSMKHISIAWPNSILYDDPKKSKFIGFTMPLIDTKSFKEIHEFWDTDDRLKSFGGKFTWRHLFTAAYNISSTIAAVHEKGYCVGDLRQTNILVNPDALITLIDCNSFQVKDPISGKIFYCRVGFGEFLPPELLNPGVNFGNKDYDRYYSDLFGLANIIFRLLMSGFDPYQAKGKPVKDANTTQAKIKKGYFPYVRRYNIMGVEPPDGAFPFEIIPPSIQKLFVKCFVDGHKEPKERPTAKEWFTALRKEIQQSN
jgi:DNA-binding helix-hairpin-helix protein with protein kinase domain